jgi:predicted AlkP superfamily pyrophosphatase or phosphodiesterase
VARLLDRGLALTGGAVAEFPSVTLCNHTSLLTGVGPGRHGIIGNVFYDRRMGTRVLANDETTWHRSAQWLRPGVATVFETLTAYRPGAGTACINEAIDRGAGYSTMQLIRDQADPRGPGSLQDALPPADASPYLTDPAHLSDSYYRWCTQVDDAGLVQALSLWQDAGQAPALTWWSHIVTDAGHHAGGPRSGIARASLREADARLGVFMDHLDGLGVLDDVVFLLTADHGFETADQTITGSWASAVAEVCDRYGVTHRDEGPGFIYLGVPPG